MPRAFGNHTHAQAIVRIGAGKAILHEQVAARQVIGDPVAQPVEGRPVDRLVDRAPIDGVFGFGIADDEFIVGRPAGMLAGDRYQRAAMGQPRLVALQRLLVQFRDAEVPEFGSAGADTLLVEPEMACNSSGLRHLQSSTSHLICECRALGFASAKRL